MLSKTNVRKIAKLIILCLILTSCLNVPLVSFAATEISASLGVISEPDSVPRSLYFLRKYEVGGSGVFFGSVYDENWNEYLVISSDAQEWSILGEASLDDLIIGDNEVLIPAPASDGYIRSDGHDWDLYTDIPLNFSDRSVSRYQHENFVIRTLSGGMAISSDGVSWIDVDFPNPHTGGDLLILPSANGYVASFGNTGNPFHTPGFTAGNDTDWTAMPEPADWATVNPPFTWDDESIKYYSTNGFVVYSPRSDMYFRHITGDGFTWQTVDSNFPRFTAGNMAQLAFLPEHNASLIHTYWHTLAYDDLDVSFKWVDDETVIKAPEVIESIRYVPLSYHIEEDLTVAGIDDFAIYDGALPQGLEFDPLTGIISGMPLEHGIFEFSVHAEGNQPYYKHFILDVAIGTGPYGFTDEGIEIVDNIGSVVSNRRLKTNYDDEDFELRGLDWYADYINSGYLIDVYYNGVALNHGSDYTTQDGSIRITIRSQTFRNNGEGTFTIAAEFRIEEDMRVAAQTFDLAIPTPTLPTYPDSPRPSRPPSTSTPPAPSGQSSVNVPAAISFSDVSRDAWYYDYVMWVVENGYMIGVGNNRFDPSAEISGAMVVTVLARLGEVDLSLYADMVFDDVNPGQWYSEAASWAKTENLVVGDTFNPNPPTPRGSLAVMLSRYFDYLDLEYATTDEYITFADADEMNLEENAAFQLLYKLGIFKGMGDNVMAPHGSTTRAQLAALLFRISAFMESAGWGLE